MLQQKPQQPQGPPQQGAGIAQAPQPTFSNMQSQGMARPGPQQGGGQSGSARQQSMNTAFDRMSREIDEQYDQKQSGVDNEMAARGLYDSNIAGDRMRHTNLQRRDAKSQMGDRLLERLGQDMADDEERASVREERAAARGDRREEMDFRRSRAGVDDRFREEESREGRRRFDLGQSMEEKVFGRRSMESDREYGEGVRRSDRDYGQREREGERDYGLRREDSDYRRREGDRRYDMDRRESDRRYDADRDDRAYDRRDRDRRYDRDVIEGDRRHNLDKSRDDRDWFETAGGLDYEDDPSPSPSYREAPSYRDGPSQGGYRGRYDDNEDPSFRNYGEQYQPWMRS